MGVGEGSRRVGGGGLELGDHPPRTLIKLLMKRKPTLAVLAA